MKRIITAALLTSLALPALAVEIGAPYEQTVQDMQLPNVKDPAVAGQASSGGTFFGLKESAPYEQNRIDMALPNVKDPVVTPRTQVAGPHTGVYGSSEATGAFANDWNFIAPPQ
jgi:hypothetical protein